MGDKSRVKFIRFQERGRRKRPVITIYLSVDLAEAAEGNRHRRSSPRLFPDLSLSVYYSPVVTFASKRARIARVSPPFLRFGNDDDRITLRNELYLCC